MMAHLLSVNVGLPRDIAWRGKTVHTAIWKAPVQGSRVVRRLNAGIVCKRKKFAPVAGSVRHEPVY